VEKLMGDTKTTTEIKATAERLFKIWKREQGARGFTQAEAAKAMGMRAQGSVSQYLNGTIPLGHSACLRFAEYLRCQPSDIDPSLEWVNVTPRSKYPHTLVNLEEISDLKMRKEAEKLLMALIQGKIDQPSLTAAIRLLLPPEK
jgi:transcriptional regulator with XRE-family HTH domain